MPSDRIEPLNKCSGGYDCTATHHIKGCLRGDRPYNPLDLCPLHMTDVEWATFTEAAGFAEDAQVRPLTRDGQGVADAE